MPTPPQAPPALFLTATGTDVGKTHLACALLHYWRGQGVSAQVLKPVLSGWDATAMDTSDTGRILHAAGLPCTAEGIAACTPWRYAAPLAPHIAAEREGAALPYNALLAWCRTHHTTTTADVLLVEGVGGVMAPLTWDHTVLDWMRDLRWPVVLVTGDYLGSLSHTLTALTALHAAGLPLAALVVNSAPPQPPAMPPDDTLHSLRAFLPATGLWRPHADGQLPHLCYLPRTTGTPHDTATRPALAQLADRLACMG